MNEKTLIIIPARNEGKAIPDVLRSINTFCPESDVLVVNDASDDDTSGLARKAGLQYGVTVLDLPFNLGIGGAMQTGFKYARENGYKIAVQIDGDGQHPAKFINKLKNGITEDGMDMVIGSRFITKKGFQGFFFRRMGIKYFSFLISFLTGLKILDVTSGFRAFGAKTISIFSDYYPHDYPEVESFVVLKKANLKVTEVSVTMKRRKYGESSINWLRGIYYAIRVSIGAMVCCLRNFSDLGGGSV